METVDNFCRKYARGVRFMQMAGQLTWSELCSNSRALLPHRDLLVVHVTMEATYSVKFMQLRKCLNKVNQPCLVSQSCWRYSQIAHMHFNFADCPLCFVKAVENNTKRCCHNFPLSSRQEQISYPAQLHNLLPHSSLSVFCLFLF